MTDSRCYRFEVLRTTCSEQDMVAIARESVRKNICIGLINQTSSNGDKSLLLRCSD